MKPKVFIGSSEENSDIAYAIQENIENDSESTVWKHNIFDLSNYTLNSLIDKMEEFDFSIFVFSPNDIAIMRNQEKQIVRDNIVLELGLFIGRLGKERTFIVAPLGNEIFHLPTDLLGITTATFNPNRIDDNLSAALGPACNKIRKLMKKLGLIPRDLNEKRSLPSLLCETIDCINKNEMKRNFNDFKGYYFGYVNWMNWDEGRMNLNGKSLIYKFLVKIDDLNEDSNVIESKLTTFKYLEKEKSSEKWGYHGVMIPIPGKLYFIFEVQNRRLDRSDFVFIITHNRPENHLLGILTGESNLPETPLESCPASARISLKKIGEEEAERGEDYLISQIGYFQPNEIDKDIREEIDNKIIDRVGFLVTFSQKCKL